jgi:carboxypeptidase C (cathepsin A)
LFLVFKLITRLLFQVLIYNGNKDIICNTPAVMKMFNSMNYWQGRTDFLQKKEIPLILKGVKAGFMKSHQNLWFVGLDKAGHMVPKDLPETSLLLIEKFINGTL